MSHTPGPWKFTGICISVDEDDGNHTCAAGGLYGEPPDPKLKAPVIFASDDLEEGEDPHIIVGLHDMYLIAQSPTLLELARESLVIIEESNPKHKIVQRLKNVIWCATGGESER